MHGNSCAAARLVGLEKERAEEHESRKHRQQPEHIHVRECNSLSLEQTVQPIQCLLAGVMQRHPGVRQLDGDRLNRSVEAS